MVPISNLVERIFCIYCFQLEGSASYLRDSIETDEHIRMTFAYQKWGKQVTALPTESEQDSQMCNPNIGATHVVTELKYGFDSHLTFTSRKSKTETKQELAGSLKIAIEKLGPISAEGSASINLTDKEKDLHNRLDFTFHGDTVIDPPPQTYEDAVAIYQSLPGRSLEYERVISFSITPLSEYCNAYGKKIHLLEKAVLQ